MSQTERHSNFAPPESHPRLRRLSATDQRRACDNYRSRTVAQRFFFSFFLILFSFFIFPRLVYWWYGHKGWNQDILGSISTPLNATRTLLVFWIIPFAMGVGGYYFHKRYFPNRKLTALEPGVPCPNCLYSLAEATNEATEVVCPECGEKVAIAAVAQ